MKAYNDTKYPIFEADQVLSQSHLNNIVSYLEEQDRLTRTGLIGVGTVCGMEVTFPNMNAVTIACGTAVTSLGFQLNWEEKTFSYYKEIELSETFLHPNIATEPFLKPVFEQAAKYTPFKHCKELVYIDPNTLADPKKVLPEGVSVIPNARFFNDHVIMLLLEASLIDVKKCVETNCDDKGKKLEFKIRPILVKYDTIPQPFLNNFTVGAISAPLYLERFNVPQTNLVNGQQVLNAFYSMYNLPVIERISNALKTLYTSFKNEAGASIANFSLLNNPRPKIEEVVKSYRSSLAIQYVYSWLSDIVDTYNEIYDLEQEHHLTNCCSQNVTGMFPLHTLLGRILTQTVPLKAADVVLPNQDLRRRFIPNEYNIIAADKAYITPWLKVAPDNKQSEKNTLTGLLEKIVLILSNFTVGANYADTAIKITPSLLGRFPLSDKSIPYYYNRSNVPLLNRAWSPSKTFKNRNTSILSYNANTYSGDITTLEPLNYDIEPYNFLRIEGHIGKPYDEVVTTLLNFKRAKRLPFNVVAINAVDFTTGNVNITTFKGDWGEIQLSYEIVARHWEDVIGKSIQWFELNAKWVGKYLSNEEYTALVTSMKSARNLTKPKFGNFLPYYQQFITLYERIEALAVAYRDIIFRGVTETISQRGELVTRWPFDAYTEDIIDQLDQIIIVCSKGQFRAVYQNAQEKWKKISQVQTLKTFLDEHPGIDSKNGVTLGGTFLIVYQDTSVVRTPIVRATPVRETPIRAAATSEKTVVFSPTIEDYSNKLKAFAGASLDRRNYDSLVKYIDKYIFINAVKDTSTIPDKAVIADFYLPYLCGSDGPVINFVVNPPNPEPAGAADFNLPDFKSPDFFAKTPPVTES